MASWLLEAGHDPVVVLDPDGRVVAWSAAAERLSGIGRTAALGSELETLLAASSGAGRPGLVVLHADRPAVGGQAQEGAALPAALLPAALLEAAPIIAAVKDDRGRYVYVNPVAAATFVEGPSPLGRTDQELWPPAVANEVHQNDLAALAADTPRRFIQSMPGPDGTREVFLHKFAFRDAAGSRLLATLGFDLTEHVAAEREMARLATAIEQAAESIVITDRDARILYVNPAFEEVTGYTAAEAIGANPRILKSGLHDADFYREMWRTLRSGRTWSGEIVNRNRAGALYRERATISPVRDPSGEIVSFVAVKRDITHEYELEARLQESTRMEAIGHLAGGIAHDFNNLLTAIRGYAELALGRPVADETRRDLRQVLETSDRATALVGQLLAFSRQAPSEPRVIDPGAILSGVAPLLRRLLGENIELRVVQQAEGARVRIDPGRLEQVIVNLAVNARDAMSSQGRLTFEIASVELDAAFVADHPDASAGPHVRIRAADTGAGMDEDTLARVFEPFFTTKGPGLGTGMGLATVYGIVRQVGGSVSAESEAGAGATFTICLPLVEPDEPASGGSTPGIRVGADGRDGEQAGPAATDGSAAAPSAATDGSAAAASVAPPGALDSATILVVEDDDAVRHFARRILERAGYRVLAAESGVAALAVSAALDPPVDLLVTDVGMPGMDGRTLAGRLRAAQPGLPVLLVSGYPQVDRGPALSDDRIALLPKPYNAAALLREVGDLLRHAQ
jgi:two-component system, cell cycle sensor histidine kinase and response regulator CckA